MRALKASAIATATVVLSALVCSRAAAQSSCPVGHPTSPTVHTVTVNLVNGAAPGSCATTTPKPGPAGPPTNYKILSSNAGDTINWNITNNCSHAVSFTLSSFTPHTGGQQIEHPLTDLFGSPNLIVNVAVGGTGLLTAHTKSPLNHYGRACTWYDYAFEEIGINGRRKTIADPQIEIPN